MSVGTILQRFKLRPRRGRISDCATTKFGLRVRGAPETFFQFVFTYGIMTAIMLLSICMYFLTVSESAPASSVKDLFSAHTDEVWSIVINAYMPTSITFVGVVLFSDGFFQKYKVRGVFLELLVVSMALAYIAFVGVNKIPLSPATKYFAWFVRCFNIILLIPSLMLMPGISSTLFRGKSQPPSDGSISF